MLRVRHLGRLVGDLVAYSAATRTVWMVPLVVFLVGVAVLATTSAVVVPYTVYTLL